jgi:hypothetical protein
MSIRAQPYRIGTYRTRDVLEGLLSNVSELNRDLASNLIVGGRRDTNATRLSDPLKPSRYVDAISENVIALDQYVTKVDPDPKQHTSVLRDTFIPLGHHGLHSYRAFDRIDHRGKLKQHPVPCGLHEAAAVFRHESVGNLAVFAECAGGADLVEAHEPRVTRHVSGDYGR